MKWTRHTPFPISSARTRISASIWTFGCRRRADRCSKQIADWVISDGTLRIIDVTRVCVCVSSHHTNTKQSRVRSISLFSGCFSSNTKKIAHKWCRVVRVITHYQTENIYWTSSLALPCSPLLSPLSKVEAFSNETRSVSQHSTDWCFRVHDCVSMQSNWMSWQWSINSKYCILIIQQMKYFQCQ